MNSLEMILGKYMTSSYDFKVRYWHIHSKWLLYVADLTIKRLGDTAIEAS